VPALSLHVGPRLDSDERIGEAVKLAADRGIPVVEAGRFELDRLTPGVVHQGIALRIRPYDYASVDEMIAAAAAAVTAQPLLVALDGVTDPRDLGASARSAAAFGGSGVIIPVRRSAGVTAAAWQASGGALRRIPVAQAPNLPRALAACAQAGLFVVGMQAGPGDEAGADLRSLDLAGSPLVLVVAAGAWLSRLVAQQCDAVVTLGVGAGESLPGPVLAGIALHQVSGLR
jgi:23S rRNA (guanosine2251-2'-O)-methyltransferase